LLGFINFFLSGAELLNKYVGESESEVFARACTPCILFFDEIMLLQFYITAIPGKPGTDLTELIFGMIFFFLRKGIYARFID
jgi:hypothetical protein